MAVKKIYHRIEQLLILVAHLALFKWILVILNKGGAMTVSSLLLHFCGIALSGAILIAFCAWRGKKKYQNDLLEKNS